jgi:hypothetical protein
MISSKTKDIVPLSQLTATPAFPKRYAGPVCIRSIKRQQKRDSEAQYETRLDLPSCKLISPTSLRILYVLFRSVNNSEHIPCRVCTFAAAWTSVLDIFLTLHIWHYTHIDHNSCKFGCERSITKCPLPAEPCAISAVSPFVY